MLVLDFLDSALPVETEGDVTPGGEITWMTFVDTPGFTFPDDLQVPHEADAPILLVITLEENKMNRNGV